MFAGLLFLWRLIMSAIFASSTNMDVFYYLTIAASFSFFGHPCSNKALQKMALQCD